jgi:hypothetical protein
LREALAQGPGEVGHLVEGGAAVQPGEELASAIAGLAKPSKEDLKLIGREAEEVGGRL